MVQNLTIFTIILVLFSILIAHICIDFAKAWFLRNYDTRFKIKIVKIMRNIQNKKKDCAKSRK